MRGVRVTERRAINRDIGGRVDRSVDESIHALWDRPSWSVPRYCRQLVLPAGGCLQTVGCWGAALVDPSVDKFVDRRSLPPSMPCARLDARSSPTPTQPPAVPRQTRPRPRPSMIPSWGRPSSASSSSRPEGCRVWCGVWGLRRRQRWSSSTDPSMALYIVWCRVTNWVLGWRVRVPAPASSLWLIDSSPDPPHRRHRQLPGQPPALPLAPSLLPSIASSARRSGHSLTTHPPPAVPVTSPTLVPHLPPR